MFGVNYQVLVNKWVFRTKVKLLADLISRYFMLVKVWDGSFSMCVNVVLSSPANEPQNKKPPYSSPRVQYITFCFYIVSLDGLISFIF